MPLEDLHIIDPLEITNADCPVFVQSSDMRSFFGWGIRKRTKSNWNHSMISRLSGKVVSQSWTYKEIDIKEYMKPGQLLKFWVCKDITKEEANAIYIKIMMDLKRPWYKKMYDWLGILGQAIGIKKINIDGLNYCTEDVILHLKTIVPYVTEELHKILINIPAHPHPDELKEYFLKHPDYFKIKGIWNSDLKESV